MFRGLTSRWTRPMSRPCPSRASCAYCSPCAACWASAAAISIGIACVALAAADDRRQILPGQVLHADEVLAVHLAELVGGDDVRVLEPRGDARLVEEHLSQLSAVREVREDPLERDDLDEALGPPGARRCRGAPCRPARAIPATGSGRRFPASGSIRPAIRPAIRPRCLAVPSRGLLCRHYKPVGLGGGRHRLQKHWSQRHTSTTERTNCLHAHCCKQSARATERRTSPAISFPKSVLTTDTFRDLPSVSRACRKMSAADTGFQILRSPQGR